MVIDYFRTRISGPEAELEDIIASQISEIVQMQTHYVWTAGSMPIGAGMPDLLAVSCDPKVFVLDCVDTSASQILAYLKAVSIAKEQTIISRLSLTKKTAKKCLDDLVKVDAVLLSDGNYSLSPDLRKILPEIVSIEVKVKNWKEAVIQASRNRIFSHRSYVALPENTALRIKKEPIFKQIGLGLLAVCKDGSIKITKRSRKHQPVAWKYYYDIALTIAKYCKGSIDDISIANYRSC